MYNTKGTNMLQVDEQINVMNIFYCKVLGSVCVGRKAFETKKSKRKEKPFSKWKRAFEPVEE